MVGVDATSAVVILGIASAFLTVTKFFFDQGEKIKATYFDDVRSVQAKIKTTRIIPRLIRFIKEARAGNDEELEDYVSQPATIQEVSLIGEEVREMYKIAEIYDSCIKSSISCWKGSLVISFLILVLLGILFVGDLPYAPLVIFGWIEMVFFILIFYFFTPLKEFVDYKEKLIYRIHRMLLDRR